MYEYFISTGLFSGAYKWKCKVSCQDMEAASYPAVISLRSVGFDSVRHHVITCRGWSEFRSVSPVNPHATIASFSSVTFPWDGPWLWPGSTLLCAMAPTRRHIIMCHGWPCSTLLCAMDLTRRYIIMYHEFDQTAHYYVPWLTRQHIITFSVSEVGGFMFLSQHLAGHTEKWFWCFLSECRLRPVVPAS
jgi:hypothetical protein